MTSPQDTQAVSITLEARPVLSYAMAHNEIPVISRLAIDHVDRDVSAARLRLEVADASGPIGESQEILLDLEAERPTVLTDVRLRLDPAAMLRVEEQRPAVIRARLETSGQVLAEQVVLLLEQHRRDLLDGLLDTQVLDEARDPVRLRGALQAGQLVPHYQPLVDLRTGRPHQLEALLRW